MPHISEEIWSCLGNDSLCISEVWPEEKTKRKIEINLAIQINGKTRQIIKIDEGLTKESILDIIKNNEKIKKNMSGKKIIREIYIPGKIVNLVVG